MLRDNTYNMSYRYTSNVLRPWLPVTRAAKASWSRSALALSLREACRPAKAM
jgi:hypothetical protein